MLDVLIKSGTVIDGTGAPGVRADVGIRNGRVSEIGRISEAAAETLDADGCLVVPGFIDPHTHYDAQLFWDPSASPSNLHGVTTVIAGNCGFTLAPLEGRDADYMRRMMAKVEGMPLAALEAGLPWNWQSFGQYLDRLDGRIGVNAAFLVGHCALRRSVMGPDSVGKNASAAQVDAMVRLLRESLAAGGLGFSTSLAFTHSDGDNQPVPSRWADRESEVLPLARALREHEGTTLELIVDGCLKGFSDAEIDLMTRMSLEAQRPLNWNVLTIDSRDPERVAHQLSASKRAAERGARVVALTMPVHVAQNMSFLTYCALFLIPGWSDILNLPVPERIAKLRLPETRRFMMERANSPEAGVLRGLTNWEGYTIGTTFAPENQRFEGRTVGEIVRETSQTATDALFDLVIRDELRTVLWPGNRDDSDESWALRARTWQQRDVLLGGSDAGAHLDRMCGSPYPTQFLADCLRGHKLLPVERAVQLLTQAPARLFGLRQRGELRAGWAADLSVIDPARVGSGPVERADDLPGNSWRLTCRSTGMRAVLVNGQTIVTDGESTGRVPGTVLRSGRDTQTVTP
jgi:N-acyl-D-aspartate/D-glutamate deacylase